MSKTFQVLPIAVKIKTRNHNVVDGAPTFLSNLMFYYYSYFLCFSPPGHFSISWMYYSVPFSWRVLCAHTLSILTLQIWALQGNLFECSRQAWWSPKYILYALMYFFFINLYEYMIISSPFYLLSTMCRRLYQFCSRLYGHQNSEKEWYSVFIQ